MGKVRPQRNEKEIQFLEIDFYKKMAYYQTEKNLKKILSKIEIDDFLIIHRYGKLYPGENIILVLVASEHRKDGLTFTKKSVEWLEILTKYDVPCAPVLTRKEAIRHPQVVSPHVRGLSITRIRPRAGA